MSEHPSIQTLETIAVGGEVDVDMRLHVETCGACREALVGLRREFDQVASYFAPESGCGVEAEADLLDVRADLVPGYRLMEEIGRGGQSVVYRAVQESTRREVAIKMLVWGRGATRQQRLRLLREAEIAASLRHPGIVTIHDRVALPGGRMAIVMELVAGVTLSEWRPAGVPRAPARREMLRMFIAVCEAVGYAHQNGVAHRDIKPSNIMVDSKGCPKVVDFGIAKAASEPDRSQTTIGLAACTPAYASPEQLSGGVADQRTDVYSLGVVLYELICGQLPRRGEGVGAAGGGDLDDLVALCVRDPSVPRDLETVVHRALQAAPERRYSSPQALAQDLECFLVGAPIMARRDDTWYVLQKLARKHRWPLSTGVVLLAIVLVGLVVMAGLYRSAAESREEADANARHFAQSMAPVQIELGRRIAAEGSVQKAEEQIWGAFFRTFEAPSRRSPDAENLELTRRRALWVLRQVYARDPCLRTVSVRSLGLYRQASPSVLEYGLLRFDLVRKRLLLCYTNGTVREIDPDNGLVLRAWDGAGVMYPHALLSADGMVYVRMVEDVVEVWDGLPRVMSARLAVPGWRARPILSADGAVISFVDREGAVCLWQWRDAEHPVRLGGVHSDPVTRSFSREGLHVALHRDRAVRTWDPQRGVEGPTFTKSTDAASVGLLEGLTNAKAPQLVDGSLVIARGAEMSLMDADGTTTVLWRGHSRRSLYVEAATGAWFGCGSDQRLTRYVEGSADEMWNRAGHPGTVYGAVVADDEDRVLSLDTSGVLKWWPLNECSNNRIAKNITRGAIFDVALQGDGGLILGTNSGEVVVTDIEGAAATVLGTQERMERAGSVCEVPGTELVAVVDSRRCVRLLNINSGDSAGVLPLPDGSGAPLGNLTEVRATRAHIAATTTGGHVIVWTVGSADEAMVWRPHQTARYLAWNPDGTRLASCGGNTDGSLNIIEWQGERVTSRRIAETGTWLRRLAWIDRDRVAAAGDDLVLRVWNVNTGELLHSQAEFKAPPCGLECSQDGVILALADPSGDISLLDTSSWTRLATYRFGGTQLWDIALAPDGRTLHAAGAGEAGGTLEVLALDAFDECVLGNLRYQFDLHHSRYGAGDFDAALRWVDEHCSKTRVVEAAVHQQ